MRQVGHVVHQGTGQRRENRVPVAQAGGEDQLGVCHGAELGYIPFVHKGLSPLHFLTAGAHEAGAPPGRWHAAEPFGVHAGKAPLEAVEVAHAIEFELQLKSAGQALRAGVEAVRGVGELVGWGVGKPGGGGGLDGEQGEGEGVEDAALAGSGGADEYGDGIANLRPAFFRGGGVLPVVIERERLGGADAAEVGHAKGKEPHDHETTSSRILHQINLS